MKSCYLPMCSLAFLVFATPVTNAARIADVDIAEEVFKSRQAIGSGELDISVVIDVRTRNPNGFTAEKHQYKVFFQGEKIRFDSVIHAQKKGKWYRMPERRVVAGNQYIFDSQGDKFAVIVDDVANITGMAEDDLFDPRILGLMPCRDIHLDQCGIEDAVRWLRDGEIVGEEVGVNGEIIWKVENKGQTRTGSEISRRASISPTMNYAVLRAEWIYGNENNREVVESDYKKYPGGVWFPEKIVYKEFREGVLYQQETTVVESAIFEADTVPDRTFTLAALELEPGTAVRRFGEKMIWDGGALIPDPRWLKETFEKTDLTNSTPGWRRIILWGNAIIFAVLAALVILRYRKKLARS